MKKDRPPPDLKYFKQTRIVTGEAGLVAPERERPARAFLSRKKERAGRPRSQGTARPFDRLRRAPLPTR